MKGSDVWLLILKYFASSWLWCISINTIVTFPWYSTANFSRVGSIAYHGLHDSSPISTKTESLYRNVFICSSWVIFTRLLLCRMELAYIPNPAYSSLIAYVVEETVIKNRTRAAAFRISKYLFTKFHLCYSLFFTGFSYKKYSYSVFNIYHWNLVI